MYIKIFKPHGAEYSKNSLNTFKYLNRATMSHSDIVNMK